MNIHDAIGSCQYCNSLITEVVTGEDGNGQYCSTKCATIAHNKWYLPNMVLVVKHAIGKDGKEHLWIVNGAWGVPLNGEGVEQHYDDRGVAQVLPINTKGYRKRLQDEWDNHKQRYTLEIFKKVGY